MISEGLQKIAAFIIIFFFYMAIPFGVFILGLTLILIGVNFLHFLSDHDIKHIFPVLYITLIIIVDLLLLRKLVRWLRR